MPKKWVVNASPIISLCSIDKASLFGFRISRDLIDAAADLAGEKGVGAYLSNTLSNQGRNHNHRGITILCK